MIRFSAVLLFAMLLVLNVKAQDDTDMIDPMLIELKARLLSTADSSAIPYANIILHRTHSGTITNTNGYFSLEMLNIDSLEVTSVGYKKTIFKIPSYYTGYETLDFYMEPVLYNVGEVRVEGKSKELDYFNHGQPTVIPPELRGDAFNERPPILAAFFNPVSYWQYHLSKREKRKRAVRQDMTVMRNWEMHAQNYNKEMVMKLTGLNEAYADTFMVWFNGQNVLPYTASEYQVRASIVEYYQLFKLDYELK
ncbi:carboxypeptidase-like regulatory domain-containing protein [Maribellus sp. YY47]|uniref:carboxypeptidase-like regulatory domain-containing protein n=1 Tax=Maribellus sp. YY47 TaxID=2929486 RepID=UPI0020012EA0|nr:carboxypeptidase-like regulatory domain-containing protein [Maribellus sp. YY47]MCK3685823.1 carboxypeptidase-like regulatory domain-containing protein [Maribellus sp. YY47]